jgi:hypothetical protein
LSQHVPSAMPELSFGSYCTPILLRGKIELTANRARFMIRVAQTTSLRCSRYTISQDVFSLPLNFSCGHHPYLRLCGTPNRAPAAYPCLANDADFRLSQAVTAAASEF